MTNASSRKLIRTALLALTLSALPATAGPDIYGLGDGSDGPLGVGSLNVMINQYAAVTGPLAPGDTFIPVSTTTGFGGNDLVLIIQMTGIVPEPPVGTPGPTDISNDPVGRWELARLASAGGTSMTLTAPLLYSYAAGVTQVVRVPEYTTVNISGSGSLIARSWNGSIGGILAFVAQGTVTNSGSISGTNRGFRSVQSHSDVTGQTGCSGLDEPLGLGGRKGEGLASTAFGTAGRGRVTNGGGGGVCLKSGAGGGGNGGAGGQGGNSDLVTDGNRPVGGQGGTALIYSSIDHLTMGGSGGAGHAANSLGQPGGAGGGIIFIRAGGLAGLGNIVTNGINAAFGSAQGGSGGGAGGTIYVRLAGPATCNLLSATGGRGANTNGSSQGTITGPGGGGGGGRILFQTCEDFCTQTATVSGGQSGVDQPTFDPYGAEAGGDGEFIVIPGCYTVLAIPVIVTPAHNSTTNDSTPDYTGTLDTGAPPGTEVVLYVDGIEVGRVTPDASGNWTFTQPTVLSEGSHTVYAVAVNTGLSLQSPPSPTHTFTIDLTPPAPPVVLLPADGTVTSDNTPTYSGTAEPGSLVTVIVDGTPVGTITASGSGTWSLTPAAPLADGPHTVSATASDTAGNTSANSNTNTFTVDTIPPSAPVVVTPADGLVTSDNTPTYSGTAEPGSLVTVIVDGASVGTITADGAGNWSLTPGAPLADGVHTVSATATDEVGNTSPSSNTNTFTVDTTAPAAPVVVTPADGSVTGDNTPTYSGTAEPGSTVTVVVDGTPIGTIQADGGGNWSLTPVVPLAEGPHTVSATATDGAGNTSPNSNTNTFTVDTIPPGAPVVVTPVDGSVIGDNTPTYSGTAEPGSTVTVIVDGTPVGTILADGAGNWSLTSGVPLADGAHTVSATATDEAGNTSPNSNTNTFTVDTTAPAAPVVVTPADGSVTGDNTPTYSGTAEPGSTVTVVVDGTPVGTIQADGAGNWSLTPGAPLADGAHTVSATATDGVGNTSPSSNTNTFTVDTLPPAAPVVVTPADGTVTGDNTPTYSGTAEPGSLVTVIVDGATVGTTTADGAGTWSLTPGTPLADGAHTVSATATDGVGNTGPSSNTNTFTVDTTAPAAPVVITPVDGSVTGDNTPTYSGTAEPGSTVTVIVDGATVGTTTADGAGNWSHTPGTPLADGAHTVSATATDGVGNTGPSSSTNTFTVDTTAPAAPVVVTPADGSVTGDNTPTYSGTAEPGSTVTVIVDGATVGTTTADGAGNWSHTPGTPLADGAHTVSATATDGVGNTGPSSSTNTFTVDTTLPPAPVVLMPANGSVTGDNTPTYSGTAEPGSTVTVIVDGASAGTTTADGAGNWSLTPGTALADGAHTVSATAMDGVGNTSPNSNTNTFTVDTTAPEAPVVVTPADGSITNDNMPTYSGTAEPGSTVTVIVDGASVGTTTADGAGNWSHTPGTALTDGPHTVSATATDGVGNTGPSSSTNTFTVDTTAPAAPVVVTPADGSLTNDNTPTYSGTAEPGSTVTVIVDGASVGTTTADGAGNWSHTPGTPLADGAHTVSATATDEAGNTSPNSNTNTFTVDTTAPAAPVVITPADGSVTGDNTPTYSGTAEPGSTVTVIVDGASVGTTLANASGDWSFTPVTGLTGGVHTVRATATDAAGNTGPDSNTNTFTVDATAPDAPEVVTPANGSASNDNTPTYSGTAEPGSTVTVIVDGTPVGTTPADGAGNWSLTPGTPLADGAHAVKAVATDGTGNTSPDSNTNTFTVDTTAPAAPVVVTPANGSLTNDNTPTYSGTAEPGSTVTVIVDGASVGTTTADGAGNWSHTPGTPLADGTHTVRATAADALGNTSPSSSTNTFTVDTTAPAAPVVETPADGSSSIDPLPVFSGTAEPNATVNLSLDGVPFATVTADGVGNWSHTPGAPLALGTYEVNATATDAAGNTSPPSNTNTFTIRPPAPGAPVISSPANNSATNDTTPTISGTADANTMVTVLLDGVIVGTTPADAAGQWALTPEVPLTDGPYIATATATDSEGVTGPASSPVRFIIDTVPPDTIIVSGPSGTIPNPDVAFDFDSDETGVTYECALNDGAFTACEDPSTFAALPDGEHTLQVRALDAAGNTDPTPATATWIVQRPPPDRALLGTGCASTGGSPSALAMMGLAVLSALLARRRGR